MAKKVPNKGKPHTLLWYVGLWATIWWGVSLLFVLLVVWRARTYYAASTSSAFSFSIWGRSIKHALVSSNLLSELLIFILIVWVIGHFIWVVALKQSKRTYKQGLQDLLLTIRR